LEDIYPGILFQRLNPRLILFARFQNAVSAKPGKSRQDNKV
jgi:hypothetical protein